MKKYLVLMALLTTGIAFACKMYNAVDPFVVGDVDDPQHLAEEVQERYGDLYGEDTQFDTVVYYHVRIGIYQSPLLSQPVIKRCGETLEESIMSAYGDASSGGGGGSGGGGVYYPTFPYNPGDCFGDCGRVEVGDPEQA